MQYNLENKLEIKSNDECIFPGNEELRAYYMIELLTYQCTDDFHYISVFAASWGND